MCCFMVNMNMKSIQSWGLRYVLHVFPITIFFGQKFVLSMTFPNELILHISSIFFTIHKICNPNPWNMCNIYPFPHHQFLCMMLWGLSQFNPPRNVPKTKRAQGWLWNRGHNCFHCHTAMIFVCTITILHTHCTMSFFTQAYVFHLENTLPIFQKHKNKSLLKNA